MKKSEFLRSEAERAEQMGWNDPERRAEIAEGNAYAAERAGVAWEPEGASDSNLGGYLPWMYGFRYAVKGDATTVSGKVDVAPTQQAGYHLIDRWPEEDYHLVLEATGSPDDSDYRLTVERDGQPNGDVTDDTAAYARRIHQLADSSLGAHHEAIARLEAENRGWRQTAAEQQDLICSLAGTLAIQKQSRVVVTHPTFRQMVLVLGKLEAAYKAAQEAGIQEGRLEQKDGEALGVVQWPYRYNIRQALHVYVQADEPEAGRKED
jgi:hypothetical protein